MDDIKPKFKEYQEDHAIVNFKVPKSWRPKLRRVAKKCGMTYSYLLRDMIGGLLRDHGEIK